MSISDSGATYPRYPSGATSTQSRWEKRPSTLPMYGRHLRFLFLLGCGLCVFAFQAHSQTAGEEPPPGPDSHETGQGPHGHLFGDWGGERTRLLERGVKFDFQYVSDSLWNIRSEEKERLASWNRVRGTMDVDFGELTGQQGLYFRLLSRIYGLTLAPEAVPTCDKARFPWLCTCGNRKNVW